ncbi:MAG TPA: hypothetical protein VKE22_28575 [Haliangiales bacterium]|nr:hypothetical protein [Haliangiales bacterium]
MWLDELAGPAEEIARARATFPPGLRVPRAFGDFLAAALALEEREGTPRAAHLRRHYFEVMPKMRAEQLARDVEPSATLMHAPLEWDRLLRFAGALDRLFALLGDAGVPAFPIFGDETAAAFRARSPTLAAMYERSYYGAFMPMIYGYPADLRFFASRIDALGRMEVIDRYLAAPLVHELAHLHPDRECPLPLYLDECVAGYLSVRVLPSFAFPPAGEDIGLFCTPWFAQVGQALVRALGLDRTLRCHAALEPWPDEIWRPAAALGWTDYLERRQPHFLGDNFRPDPWLALFDEVTPPGETPMDREIVEDALRAMCVDNHLVGATFRVVSRPPPAPIEIDLATRRVSTAPGAYDPVRLSYPFPAATARRLIGQGIRGYTLKLADLDAISALADVLYAGGGAVQTSAYQVAPWPASSS